MPSGPEHYREAEELIAAVSDDDGTVQDHPATPIFLAAAQVHATLAQAAAIALSCPVDDQPPEDAKQWHKVAGSKPSKASPEAGHG